jgi:imidazoleglycerol phosphate synthase glutamine amidotransferase subunit HisH
VIDYTLKLLRNVKNDELRKRVHLLGVTLGMSMIKMPSIEKKIVGCKIINKFSY